MAEKVRSAFLIQFGSSYSSDPWENKTICLTQKDAEEYIEREVRSRGSLRSLFHISPIEIYKSAVGDKSFPTCQAYDRNENCAMSPEEFASNMKFILDGNYDGEQRHIEMDGLMCDLLVSLGYSEGVNVFINAPKWYS